MPQTGAAAAGRGGNGGGREGRRPPPPRAPAVGGSRNPDTPGLGHAGPDKRLDATTYILLLAPAPAVYFDRLLEREPEPSAPPVVRGQHVETPREEVLDLGVEPVLSVVRGSAVDQYDCPCAPPRRPVQPPLHLEPVHRVPGEVLRGNELLRSQRGALPQPGQAGQSPPGLCRIETDEVCGVPGVV